jgi:hypothetical protein
MINFIKNIILNKFLSIATFGILDYIKIGIVIACISFFALWRIEKKENQILINKIFEMTQEIEDVKKNNENIILLSLKKDTEINNFIKKNLTTDFKVKSLDKIIENFKLKEKENQKLYQSNISFEEKYKICIEEKELFINANNQVKKGVFN